MHGTIKELKSDFFDVLKDIRSKTGPAYTSGVELERLKQFANDANLKAALFSARAALEDVYSRFQKILILPEKEAMQKLHEDFLNFYSSAATSPYIPLVAKGPWIITCYGSVVYDTGGYGMMGLGHDPDAVRSAMARPTVMANIMTPSLAQLELSAKLKKEIGQTRDTCPFEKFICLNSGSESMTFAMRLADLNARKMTDLSAKYAGWEIKRVALKGAFHGRTEGPAYVSDSCAEKYQALASYRNYTGTLIVEPNDIADLERVFTEAKANKWFIECMLLEPVLGEGNPGLAINPEFYIRARELTQELGALLIIDSIQAGIRAQGYLSIVDYPGFSNLAAPDVESYSKAINAGQYPLSVLALSKFASSLYKVGVYGNTMTTNSRALSVACVVLESLTDELRQNIRTSGAEFVDKLKKLQARYPDIITLVQGTGLLLSTELVDRIKVVGENSIEDYIRRNGVNVIHGGKNALRFTPGFSINSKEIDLIVDIVEQGILKFR